MIAYSILLTVFVVITGAKEQIQDPQDLSISLRLFSRWRTRSGVVDGYEESARYYRGLQEMTIVSSDASLSDLDISPSYTIIDFSTNYMAIFVDVNVTAADNLDDISHHSPSVDNQLNDPILADALKDSQTMDSESTSDTFWRRNWVPVCFIAPAPTVAVAKAEIGRRIWSREVPEGTPQYFTTDWSAPLSRSDLRAKSVKLHRHCFTRTSRGRTYELTSSSSSQATELTISGQIDAAQSETSVPYAIELQNFSV